jgi:carbonic anhydrase/acetyltransferase-like protein (isoleucine patch superfamily)
MRVMILNLGEDRPEVADSAWVAPNATVVGRVRLAADVSIWYGAVLRGDENTIEIGAGSNVQDNCVFHTDPGVPLRIGESVNIGHGAIVHGATVEDGSLIGMGAILLNGSLIGEGSIIGAGTLIPQGARIPPHSLVIGSPGKVRRTTTEEERARVLDGCRQYVLRARRHLAANS